MAFRYPLWSSRSDSVSCACSQVEAGPYRTVEPPERPAPPFRPWWRRALCRIGIHGQVAIKRGQRDALDARDPDLWSILEVEAYVNAYVETVVAEAIGRPPRGISPGFVVETCCGAYARDPDCAIKAARKTAFMRYRMERAAWLNRLKLPQGSAAASPRMTR